MAVVMGLTEVAAEVVGATMVGGPTFDSPLSCSGWLVIGYLLQDLEAAEVGVVDSATEGATATDPLGEKVLTAHGEVMVSDEEATAGMRMTEVGVAEGGNDGTVMRDAQARGTLSFESPHPNPSHNVRA